MLSMKLYGTCLAVVLAVAGTTVAVAGPRGRAGGLKALGLKAYWSVLREDQKEEAKSILADHLATTAPDRLTAAARVLEYRANVAAVLTKEQRLEAGKMFKNVKALPEGQRWALVDKLLDATDRNALADRVERSSDATPEARVEIGTEIFDQVFETLEPKLAEKLGLSQDQRDRIRDHYSSLKTDLKPTAIRLAQARAQTIRKAMALLDAEQRQKLEDMKKGILGKILGFIRG